MEESRRRMQEKLDADAARYLEEQQKVTLVNVDHKIN